MAKNTPIRHIKSSVSGAVPAYTSLDYGELGINYSDGALFFRDTGDNVIPVASVNNNLVTGEYLFSTTTTASDPGSGLVRLNSATRSSVTSIYIDKLSNLKTDVDAILRSVVAGDVMVWQDKSTATNTVRYRVTGAPTNNTGWWTIPVEWMSETGSLWTANTLLSFTLHRIGTIGTNGLVNGAVTLAKMADMATSSLIYRKTAGSGAPEVNTLATLKTDLGLTGTNSGDQTITLTGDVTGSGTGSFAATIASGAVSLSKMANMATSSLIYRKTAGSGAPEVNTLATLKTDLGLTGTNSGDQTISLTGDVTGSGTGSFAATIASGAVTLAKMANMATSSLIYRKTAGSGAPEVNTLATLKTDLGLTGTNSGDQTITLTGDVTGSGTGSFAATIANGAVTAAKQPHGLAILVFGETSTDWGTGTTLTAAFPTGRTSFSVVASQIYLFEGSFTVSKSGGTATPHTLRFGFGGTATFDAGGCGYEARTWIGNSGVSSVNLTRVSTQAATAVSASTSTSGAEVYNVKISGYLYPNASGSGTIIPSFCWNTSPGAATSVTTIWPSWFRITSLGVSTASPFVNMS